LVCFVQLEGTLIYGRYTVTKKLSVSLRFRAPLQDASTNWRRSGTTVVLRCLSCVTVISPGQ
jgi:hypothetical protein